MTHPWCVQHHTCGSVANSEEKKDLRTHLFVGEKYQYAELR